MIDGNYGHVQPRQPFTLEKTPPYPVGCSVGMSPLGSLFHVQLLSILHIPMDTNIEGRTSRELAYLPSFPAD